MNSSSHGKSDREDPQGLVVVVEEWKRTSSYYRAFILIEAHKQLGNPAQSSCSTHQTISRCLAVDIDVLVESKRMSVLGKLAKSR